jgi:hypothetical protein
MSGIYDIGPQPYTALDLDIDPSLNTAIEMMKDQLQRRSRASSPSRDAQQWSWYSALPQLGVYDDAVINVLVNVSRRHIGSTFAIFADFEASSVTRVDLCLAMAAVGGLYCMAPNSTKIAKMLFNDARRLMLEDYLQHNDHTFDDYLSFTKTFILLELYGLCSGDKRAYEFMEVFHGTKLLAASCCVDAIPSGAFQVSAIRLGCSPRPCIYWTATGSYFSSGPHRLAAAWSRILRAIRAVTNRHSTKQGPRIRPICTT